MVQMTFDVPELALAAMRKSPEEFAKEFRLAAAVKWYELRQLSQERASDIAGLSRAEFIEALAGSASHAFQCDLRRRSSRRPNVNEVWVANASPIIVLAKCGYLDLLSKLSREVVIPQAVVDEIVAGPVADRARQWIDAGWGTRASPRLAAPELLEWGLGPGETSVLALAQERKPAVAVLDDAAARACAKVIGVPVIGSLGIIVRAKKHGLLRSAAEAMKLLHGAGLYLDNETVRSALQHVGETWKAE